MTVNATSIMLNARTDLHRCVAVRLAKHTSAVVVARTPQADDIESKRWIFLVVRTDKVAVDEQP